MTIKQTLLLLGFATSFSLTNTQIPKHIPLFKSYEEYPYNNKHQCAVPKQYVREMLYRAQTTLGKDELIYIVNVSRHSKDNRKCQFFMTAVHEEDEKELESILNDASKKLDVTFSPEDYKQWFPDSKQNS